MSKTRSQDEAFTDIFLDARLHFQIAISHNLTRSRKIKEMHKPHAEFTASLVEGIAEFRVGLHRLCSGMTAEQRLHYDAGQTRFERQSYALLFNIVQKGMQIFPIMSGNMGTEYASGMMDMAGRAMIQEANMLTAMANRAFQVEQIATLMPVNLVDEAVAAALEQEFQAPALAKMCRIRCAAL